MNKLKKILLSDNRLYILIMLLMSVLFLWRILPDFSRAIPYSHNPDPGFESVENFQGDHLQWLYHLVLPAKALAGKTELFSEGFQFQTPYKSSYINLHFPPAGLIYLLFYPLGLATAYNMTLLFFLFLSLICCWLMLKDFNFSNVSSLAGSCIYSFAPYKLSVMTGGHPAGMLLAILPLFIFLFNRMMYTGKKRYGLYAGLALICLAASEPHYHYYLVIGMPLLFIILKSVHILPAEFKNPLYHYKVSDIIMPFRSKSLALTSLLIFLFSYFFRRSMPLLPAIPLTIFIMFVFSTAEIFIRNTIKKDSCFYSFSILNLYTLQFIYEIPMLATILISAVFILFLRHSTGYMLKKGFHFFREELKKTISYLPFAVGLFLSVVYMLHVKSANYDSSGIKTGRTLSEISLYAPNLSDIFNFSSKSSSHFVFPGFLAFVIISAATLIIAANIFRKKNISKHDYLAVISTISFYFFYLLSFGPNIDFLPIFTALRKIVPYFSFIRSPIKIIVLAFLSLSFTTAALISKRKLAVAITILIFSETLYLHSSFGICYLNKQNPVFQEIAKAEKKILYLPVWPGNSSWESLYQLYSIYTDKEMINGYQPAVPQGYIDNIADKLYSLNLGIINEDQFSLLKSLEVDTLVFNKEAFPRKVSPFPQQYTLDNLKNSPFLQFQNFKDPLAIFKLKQKPANTKKLPLSFPTGFMIEAEHSHRSEKNTTLYKDQNASLKQGVLLKPEGELSFRKHFPSGNYKFTSSLSGNRNVKIILTIYSGNSVLAEETLKNSNNHTISFRQDNSFSLLSFIIKNISSDDAGIDFLYIENDNLPFPELIEAGDGIYTGEIKTENGEKIISIDDSSYNKGPGFFTPNRLLPAGSYIAEYTVQYSPENKMPLRLAVTDAHGINSYAEKLIAPENLTKGKWELFTLPFQINEKENVINLLTEYPGKGNLKIKNFAIRNES